MQMTTSNAPIGARVFIPLDNEGRINYEDAAKDRSFIVATIIGYNLIGFRKGEKTSKDYTRFPFSQELKIDTLLCNIRAVSGIRCYPAKNRRVLCN